MLGFDFVDVLCVDFADAHCGLLSAADFFVEVSSDQYLIFFDNALLVGMVDDFAVVFAAAVDVGLVY